jgi:hypothetical protein
VAYSTNADPEQPTSSASATMDNAAAASGAGATRHDDVDEVDQGAAAEGVQIGDAVFRCGAARATAQGRCRGR